MFDSVLVANRGEIAVRIFRTLRRLGIRSLAVYSDADAGSPHVLAADVAVRIESYLSPPELIRAAGVGAAQAIHPGYGFLSENPAFARACEEAGLVFVGPPATAVEAMGDKIRARNTVSAAGVPVVPGSTDPDEVGYPLLIKPSAGGGGKGMHEVHRAGDLDGAVQTARREARAAFGDDTLLFERLVTTPRHIEIQVLADRFGAVTHLGERECSLQRRHQKVVEECPSPLLPPEQRETMGEAACRAAQACGYVGAGTVEFIVTGDRPHEWYFMEMNTRLQVEHPVTEEVYGVDLVEAQLRIAAGEPAPWPAAPRAQGHAIEVRLYAEDPAAGFLPSAGEVLALELPDGVRVDSGVTRGQVIGTGYDPMLAKIIAHGPHRAEALRRLSTALRRTVVLGVQTNTGFLLNLLADQRVRDGDLDTGLIGRDLEELTAHPVPDDVLGLAAGLRLLGLEPPDDPEAVIDPFDLPGGWRIGEPAGSTHRFDCREKLFEVRSRGRADDALLIVDGGEPVRSRTQPDPDRRPHVVHHTHDGVTRTYTTAAARDGTLWITRDGLTWALREPLAAGRAATDGGGGPVRSPMPGTIALVSVQDGEKVSTGQPLAVVEAMKMEHTLTSPADGVVRELRARPGATVTKDEVLMTVEPFTEGDGHGS
ncbi:hypothetical protein KIH74_30955 [Kineosporia sp. J2-2]|uniref:biotin carboxylase n=1 Tax=Kineosporia corallincola TaxID=2835133 RepID=A0ABS5TRI5_9ACTN|nr:biotin carboxylase N-terminal domain-containing protein [Kineosporia corallincola]MBT0773406.1 hypothetical protein [Kineosporia corallincola]